MTNNHTQGDCMFKDRFDASQQLAQKLMQYKNNPDTVILVKTRGSFAIGTVISQELHIPVDIFLSKKIGYPGNPNYTIGMVTLDDIIIDKRALEFSGEMQNYLKKEVAEIRNALQSRAQQYYKDHQHYLLQDKVIIIVDEGIATGKTMEVVIDLIKKKNPKKVIVAAPVASKEALHLIRKKVDEIVCLQVPDIFMNVSQWYQKYDVSDEL